MAISTAVSVLFMIQLALAPSALAKSCAQKYSELNQTLSRGFVTSSDQVAIDRIMMDRSLTAQEKAKRVFHQTLEARLRLLPKSEADEVREAARDVERRVLREGRMVNGKHQSSNGQVFVDVLPSIQGTLIEYAMRMHELEHEVQRQMVAKRISNKTSSFFKSLFADAEAKFEKEKGAMIAEWNYLKSIPSGDRRSLAQAILQDPSLGPQDRKTLAQILLSADAKSAEDYLKSQWGSGRYDLKGLRRERRAEIVEDSVFGVSIAVAGGASAALAAAWSCQRSLQNPGISAGHKAHCEHYLNGLDRAISRSGNSAK